MSCACTCAFIKLLGYISSPRPLPDPVVSNPRTQNTYHYILDVSHRPGEQTNLYISASEILPCPQSLVSPPKSDDPPSRRPVSFCSLLRGTRCAKPIQILHFSPWDKLRFVAVYPEMECNIFAVLADMGACFVSTFLLRSGKPLDT